MPDFGMLVAGISIFVGWVYILAALRRVHAEDALQFIAIGDWGKGGINGDATSVSKDVLLGNNNNNKNSYTYQVAVAKAAGKWASSTDIAPSFIVALGDNFYTDGVSSTSDSMWSTHWSEVYLKNFTGLRVPWYPVFGNHDYGYGVTGTEAQIDRYRQNIDNGLWMFEAYNYSKVFDIPGTNAKLAMIFTDTTTLAPSENKCCNENGGISTAVQQARIASQVTNIERMIESIMAKYSVAWLVIAGHYPIYSMGGHGDTDELLKYLLPIIWKYKAHVYISGHDHISEHLNYNGTEYFIAGAGSMTDKLGGGSVAQLLWSGTGYSSFTTVRVTAEYMKYTYHHWNGTIMYDYMLTNPFTVDGSGNPFPTMKPTDRAHAPTPGKPGPGPTPPGSSKGDSSGNGAGIKINTKVLTPLVTAFGIVALVGLLLVGYHKYMSMRPAGPYKTVVVGRHKNANTDPEAQNQYDLDMEMRDMDESIRTPGIMSRIVQTDRLGDGYMLIEKGGHRTHAKAKSMHI